MKLLMITFIISTFINAQNFVKGQDIVNDKKNSLVWQDSYSNIREKFTFEGAQKYCKDLELQGRSNWYVPSREEYNYIIDKTREDELMINRQFKYIMAVDYWTSESTWRSFGKYGYFVFFKSGHIYYQNKTYKKFVRCVSK
jgi:hypothetical protein